jgi:integrase
MYALLGVGMMRHGEAAGLRWRAYDATMEPLGRLEVSTSYDDGETKTETPRYMPAHPALAALLAEWKLTGWEAAFGHAPGPDDLVLPVTPEEKRKGRKKATGAMRDRHYTWKRAQKDLDLLGLRRRRVHDLRRTGITLARGDGADRDILRRGTHAAARRDGAVHVRRVVKAMRRGREAPRRAPARRYDRGAPSSRRGRSAAL